MVPLIDLPALPLTGLLCPSGRERAACEGIDQEFVWCEQCRHGRLKHVVSRELLYGRHYAFRTSMTTTARDGIRHFVAFLRELIGPGRFRTVLDVGCNDVHLTRLLAPLAERCIGIDPVWADQDGKFIEPNIQVLAAYIEDISHVRFSEMAPDLIVCRHVLEHLADPRAVLHQLMQSAAPDALFLVEIPEFSSLLKRYRFDQIFHEHVQYFTLHSLLRLIDEVGGIYRGHRENFHHWGSVMVAFQKKATATRDTVQALDTTGLTPQTIVNRYASFKQHMRLTRDVLERESNDLQFGYGASPMLPVLAYHLETDFSHFQAIVDDDRMKHGKSYANLPLSICSPDDLPWTTSTVMITAPESGRSLLHRSFQKGARQVVYPLPLVS